MTGPERSGSRGDYGRLRARLRSREQLLGSFCIELGSETVPEAMAQAGFDFVVIDTEHSAFSPARVRSLVTACRAFGISSIVRINGDDRLTITRTADMAPDGLMFPGVETVEQAKAILEAARYAPLGLRGVAPMVAHSRLPADSRFTTLNEELAVIMQIEGHAAVEAAAAIANVPGVDAIFIGTYDLSQSLGIPGLVEDPRVYEAGAIIRRDLPESAALGVYVWSGEMADRWTNAGATLVAYGTDGQLFLASCRMARRSTTAGDNDWRLG
jgi:2-keto-3-deoxy-L-rhamnonate aldolase RhmA